MNAELDAFVEAVRGAAARMPDELVLVAVWCGGQYGAIAFRDVATFERDVSAEVVSLAGHLRGEADSGEC